MHNVRYLYDKIRHLVCVPYSVANLHAMANELRIGRHWYDPKPYPHYDVPKRMMQSIGSRATLVRPREVLAIVKGQINELLIRQFVCEEVDRLVRSTAGMVGGADVGRSSGNRPSTMAALGGERQLVSADDVMNRAEELHGDLTARLDDISAAGLVPTSRIENMRYIVDRSLLGIARGDKQVTSNQLAATIDSLLDALDALESAV